MGFLGRIKALLGGTPTPETGDVATIAPAGADGPTRVAGWSGPETDHPRLVPLVESMMEEAAADDFGAARFDGDEFQAGIASLLEADELGDLVAILRRAATKLRHHMPLVLVLARVAMARFDDASARDLWLELVTEPSHCAEALFSLGELALRSSAEAEAATYFQRALAHDVSYPGAWERAMSTASHLPMPSAHRAAATAGGVAAGMASAAGAGVRPPEGFKLVHPLGSGGYGTVYLARDLRLRREVALKFLHPHLTQDTRRVNAFFEEARLVARLAFPGVVRIYDLAPADRLISMEYLTRGTLRDRLASGRQLSPDAALRVCTSLLRTLSGVHGAGLVHRDIKPANILFRSDGTAVLGDFGVASLESGSERAGPAGTVAYMSPEQRAGGRGDRRADLYAVGLVLAEMLSGVLPTASGDGTVDASLAVALLPESLGALFGPLLERLLAPDPDVRFATAAAALDEMAELDRRLAVRRQGRGLIEDLERLSAASGHSPRSLAYLGRLRRDLGAET